MKRNKRRTGAALITALIITAVVATIATLIVVKQRINLRETELMTNADRIYLYAQGVQNWAIAELTQNALKKMSQPQNRTLMDSFPNVMKTAKQDNAVINGALFDEQSLFNINSLATDTTQFSFMRLLQFVDPQLNRNQQIRIMQAILQWMTPSNADDIYLRASPPYRASHHAIVSISELLLIQGITPELFLALKPYITALPTNVNKINVNTAPTSILMTLNNTMSMTQANGIIACRNILQGFSTLEEFTNCTTKLGMNIDTDNITLQSDYFLMHANVHLGRQQLDLFSLLKREIQTSQDNSRPPKINIDVLWQSRNTL